MIAILQDTFLTILVSLITLVGLTVAYVKFCYGYWKRRGVPHLEPKFPFGNSDSIFPKGISIGAITKNFYGEFKSKGQLIGGVYIGIEPKLVLLDPDLIRNIMIKDFQSFTDRGIYFCKSDPISVNIFAQNGSDWKHARLKFTSIFTTAKMKSMFQTMIECSAGLKGALEKLSKQKNDIDILEVAGCFTTDVIGSCAFGIDCNSFRNPDAEFRKMGRKLFAEFNIMDRINLFLSIYMPKFSQKIGVRNVQKEVSRFFFKSIKETLLIDMKNSDVGLSTNELVAQVFLFFIGGFETSSSTICLSLFEISKDEEVQEKLREEIREVLKKYDDKITYDAIAEMKYLAQVVDETLRLWPPVATIPRVCTEDYKFENTDITVEKGIFVLIPALGLHHDPQYWPDPMRWDPERFSDENKQNRRPFTYLPFGEGPRNCLGMRFGLLQTKIALATVLRNYRVSLSPKTVTPLGIDMETFVLHNVNKVYLRVEEA